MPRPVSSLQWSYVLVSDFDYHLPVDRTTGKWEDRMFRDFPSYLKPHDCLVLNDSRVIPSRLYGRREHGTGRVEIFLLKPISTDQLTWEALVRPGSKMR